MIKNFFTQLKMFWIIYLTLFFLSIIGGIFITSGIDIISIWVVLFYMPFMFFLVYPYGFLMGFLIQKKLKSTAIGILLLSIIYFVLVLLLLMACGISGILTNGVLYHFDIKLYPALGSTLLFTLGAIIAKFKYQK
ncbi:MAG TPA: hypothetical protein DEF85_07640 [Clostridiaceae bacterium]|jgi:hypothetical protein|nr:hypothetical protein [Clostridiaceae bacterium]HBX48747.1 hypothetical protein [Clostridiaceae bacterium]HCS10765.1 hypothetical protein [Clostridiales bacterium]